MRAFDGVPDIIIDGEFARGRPAAQARPDLAHADGPDACRQEGFTRLTHEIEAIDGGVTKLTVIHELESAPTLAAMVAGESEADGAGGGWAWVLSDLKSLLRIGRADGRLDGPDHVAEDVLEPIRAVVAPERRGGGGDRRA